uniref:Nitric oxide synthase-interacting protein zinc-finger domain-containing protein n=2 Tax=Sus scrofa TaxID=9823 RepID=A0A8D0T5U4_PIG
MKKHCKNCTAEAFYTYHEKEDMAASGSRTQDFPRSWDVVKDLTPRCCQDFTTRCCTPPSWGSHRAP